MTIYGIADPDEHRAMELINDVDSGSAGQVEMEALLRGLYERGTEAALDAARRILDAAGDWAEHLPQPPAPEEER